MQITEQLALIFVPPPCPFQFIKKISDPTLLKLPGRQRTRPFGVISRGKAEHHHKCSHTSVPVWEARLEEAVRGLGRASLFLSNDPHLEQWITSPWKAKIQWDWEDSSCTL